MPFSTRVGQRERNRRGCRVAVAFEVDDDLVRAEAKPVRRLDNSAIRRALVGMTTWP
jgi:hypothetical protein